jgi:hypothetical protein
VAADGPLGSALVDRVEGACEPVLPPHSGDRGQSPRGGDDDYGPQWDDGSGSGTAVCNTAVIWPPPLRPDPSLGKTRGGSKVEVRYLRAAIDHADVSLDNPIDEAVWEDLIKLTEGDFPILHLVVADSPPLSLKVRRDPMRPAQVVCQGDGLFLRVVHPDAVTVSLSPAVEVQVHGELLATSPSGGQGLVLSVVAAVSRLFWPSNFQGGQFTDRQVLAAMDEVTRIGEVHVAVDVGFSGEARDEWITEAIFANGSHVEAVDRFSTRARRKESIQAQAQAQAEPEADDEGEATGPVRLLGTAEKGRTLYLGRSLIELCVYEKDRAPIAKRSTALALETLKAGGWNPDEERVIRWEARLKKAWWRDQKFEIEPAGGGAGREDDEGLFISGERLTLSQWEKLMPDIVAKLPQRTRHTDHLSTQTRVRRRDSSAWQLQIEEALSTWEDKAGDPERVVAHRREQTIERARAQIFRSAARLAGVTGKPIADTLEYMTREWDVIVEQSKEDKPTMKLLVKIENERKRYEHLFHKGVVKAA